MSTARGLWLVLAAGPGSATEGGSSLYLQGAHNDFAAGMFQATGVYIRNDVAFYDASVGARPLGGRVALESTQRVWLNLTKLAYQAEGAPSARATARRWSCPSFCRRRHRPRRAVDAADRRARLQPDRQMDPRYRHAEPL
jgi:hypothetical protein